MPTPELIARHARTDELRRQALFASILIIQNRLQTACDKLDPEITLKQWLLLAMASTSETPLSLSQLAALMGCSRQNVKKLALLLEKKGFLTLADNPRDSRSLCLLAGPRLDSWKRSVQDHQNKILSLLFKDFSEAQTTVFYELTMQLYQGLERIENYAEKESTHENTDYHHL